MRWALVIWMSASIGCGAEGADPCSADQASAASTVGCNGPAPGNSIARNEFGGACTPDPAQLPNEPPRQGSCRVSLDRCVGGSQQLAGICLRQCEAADTYVSRGSCPLGSRCFTGIPKGNNFCRPDCTMDSQCTTAKCDAEGGCAPMPP
ncbi:MAG: hypothetical protein H0T46_16715 [Deltaproteobacteria bacterium]|nr:hypothetical protein [Deltaproteobacteria bacterium]